MESLAKIVPLAVVMVAGPQIVSAIMLAVSENAKKGSLAFIGGAMSAATLGTAVIYTAAKLLHAEASSGDSSASTIDYVFLVLLVLLAIRVFMKRKQTEPPKWMSKLQTAKPKFALQLGFVLFLLMPTDILTMLTVGSYLATHGNSLIEAIPFLLVTALFIGSPLIIILAMGERAKMVLPKLRDWMNSNSWIVSEAVIGLFLLLQIQTILSD